VLLTAPGPPRAVCNRAEDQKKAYERSSGRVIVTPVHGEGSAEGGNSDRGDGSEDFHESLLDRANTGALYFVIQSVESASSSAVLCTSHPASLTLTLPAASALAAAAITAMLWIAPDSGSILALAATPALQLAVTVPLDRLTGPSRAMS
jgi:hypothetical protein